VRSTTFLFTTLCTCIQILGESCSGSRVHHHNRGMTDAAPRRAATSCATFEPCLPHRSRRTLARAPTRAFPRLVPRLPNAPLAPGCTHPKAPGSPRRVLRAVTSQCAPSPSPGRFRDVASVTYKGADRPCVYAADRRLPGPPPRAMGAATGERSRSSFLRFRGKPNTPPRPRRSSTLPLLCRCSPYLAGARTTAAAAARCRRGSSPALPPPQPRVEIEPRAPLDHPTPVPS
jgi:hypothetical protein